MGKPFFLLVICVQLFLFTHIHAASGWDLLIENKPQEALKAFYTLTENKDNNKKAEGHKGLAFTYKFLGEYDSTTIHFLKAYKVDKNRIDLAAVSINILSFGREWIGHKWKDGYSVLKDIDKNRDLYSGDFSSLYIQRLINDGDLKEAKKKADQLGIIRDFVTIGPFENTSGSGYGQVFPPEKELDFSKLYEGKEGKNVNWNTYHNEAIDGWLYVNKNYPLQNSVNYYVTNVVSEKEQEAYISFGASGTFKVFFNGSLILADSQFKNTGVDMFMQKVTLSKGDNALLVKIGHEDRYSNFNIRVCDSQGNAIPSVSYKTSTPNFTLSKKEYTNLLNAPVMDTIVSHLTNRIQKNPQDHLAYLLLMEYFNATERTDKGEELAVCQLRKYQQSALWCYLYSGALSRAQKYTEWQRAVKIAYALSNKHFGAWQNELEGLAQNGSSEDIKKFIENSYKPFQEKMDPLIYLYGIAVKNGLESDAYNHIQNIESRYTYRDSYIDVLILDYYRKRGDTRYMERYLKKKSKYNRGDENIYNELANLYLKQGKPKKAIKAYRQLLQYIPNSPETYTKLARLEFKNRFLNDALSDVKKALSHSFNSPSLLNLQGEIYKEMNNLAEAKKTFQRSIDVEYNNFEAWEQLLPLQGKKDLTELTQRPDYRSIRASSELWEGFTNEKGSALCYTKDIHYYPSKCSREKYYLMVHLPTQKAVEMWKEYSISYNGYYQTLSISKAVSVRADGIETPADVKEHQIVFKALKPGDDIILEWTLSNYYEQEMAQHVWGFQNFDLVIPVYSSELRLVSPKNDTIPYRVQGKDVTKTEREENGFIIKEFSRKPYLSRPTESFAVVEPKSMNMVYFSTIPDWSYMVNWYNNVTANKSELSNYGKWIVDSLITENDSDFEKGEKIYNYITQNIRYSFVPFRQSGWIPQKAHTVLATKIGDCKDVSALGKTLFEYAGIKSHLVLVNTADKNGKRATYIGPNFNHCILASEIDGEMIYSDMTGSSLSFGNLPRMDQGAVALIINEKYDSIINLPVDKPKKRAVVRHVETSLSPEGTLTRIVTNKKFGINAGAMRENFRFLSDGDRVRTLSNIIGENYPDNDIIDFTFDNIDSLSDSIMYSYSFEVENAVKFSGNIGVVSLHLPDIIEGEDFPIERDRETAVDMHRTWLGVGHYEMTGIVDVPKKWKPVTLPDNITLKGEWGSYELTFTQKKNSIHFTRKAHFNFDDTVSGKEYEVIRKVLTKIAQADDAMLIFFVK